MELNTAAEIISFARQLEEDGARFYESLTNQFAEDKETLLAFARENAKNVVQVERAYYGVISDALEGCFTFKVNPAEYTFTSTPAGNVERAAAFAEALKMEEKTVKFYTEAAAQSKSLLADVPRAFALAAKKRESRKATLQSLAGEKA